MSKDQNNNQQQTGTPAVKKFTEDTVGKVLKKVSAFQTQGELKLPINYSAENSVRSAWLILQDVKNADKQPALSVCTPDSIANALLDMVLQGLSPVKKQCYFVVYGNKLVLQKSYIGNIAISKRVANVKEVKGVPIYKEDQFEYEINLENGRKKITKHTQKFENIDPDKVVGAYAIVTENDAMPGVKIMNMKQIQAAWSMGNANGNSKAHKNFADEMACKTVINRALKIAVGATDDGELFKDDELDQSPYMAGVKQEISDKSGTDEPLGFDEEHEQQKQAIEEQTPDAEEVKAPF